jgi:hypothetical protein
LLFKYIQPYFVFVLYIFKVVRLLHNFFCVNLEYGNKHDLNFEKTEEMSKKPLKVRTYSTEKHHIEKEVLAYDYMRTSQVGVNETARHNNNSIKSLTVKIDDSKFNFEQSSLENASSKGLINESRPQFGSIMKGNQVAISSSSPTMTTNTDDSNHSLSIPNMDRKLKKKPAKSHKSSSTPPAPAYFTCYIIQQYFIYLILFAIIVSGSFGFYYLLISTNLKIEELERKLNDKISTRLAIQLLTHGDFFDKNIKQNGANGGDYSDFMSRTVHFKQKLSEDELKGSKFPDRHRFFLLSNANETGSSSGTVFTENYYVMKRMSNFNFVIYPAHTKNSVTLFLPSLMFKQLFKI